MVKYIEMEKETARAYYPEIFNFDDGIPGNIEEAYNIFSGLAEKPEGFDESFKEGGDSWCDVYDTENGKIAVWGVGSLSSFSHLFVIEEALK